MFSDTREHLWDDDETKDLKAKKRRSNYYEKKRDSLQSDLTEINKLINQAKSDYKLMQGKIVQPKEHVMQYEFYQTKSNMHEKSKKIITELESKRDVLKKAKDEAEGLRQKYYNEAIKGSSK